MCYNGAESKKLNILSQHTVTLNHAISCLTHPVFIRIVVSVEDIFR
jgi:hypothetical protein